MARINIHTKGELLLIMISNFILFNLTKYPKNFSFTGRSFGEKIPKKIIVDKNKFNKTGKVFELLHPFMSKSKPSLYPYHSFSIENIESPRDFDPMKLYEFRDICVESLKKQSSNYFDGVKHCEEYKKLVEEIAKKKNKVPKIKRVSKDILDYNYIINQVNYMVQIFSDAKQPEDLIKLELFNK